MIVFVGRAKRVAVVLGAGAIGAALRWRRNPSACPYSQRFWVQAPHPFITRERLLATLNPGPGERVLEIGPGTGYYTIDAARALRDGRLDIFDLQQEMLDHTMARVRHAGLDNVVAQQGDATQCPYENRSFDAVFLVTVLGEIPDRVAALREIARVLKPGGRLVVGELFGDPHMVTLSRLRRESEDVGLLFETRSGPRLGFFAVLRRPT